MPDPEQATGGDNADQSTGTTQQQADIGGGGDNTPQFDPGVLSRAQSQGFSQDEIDTIGPANLSMVMRAADRMAAPGAPQPQPQADAGQQQGQMIDPMQFAAALNLNKDDVDENVINALNAVNSHYANQSVQMMGAIGELVRRLGTTNDTVGRMTFNSHVDALGEDWHSVLGPPNKRNSKELEKLHKHVGVMQQTGTTADYGEAFQRALGSLYFARLQEMERKAHNNRVVQGLQGTSERSRSREEEPPQSGKEKAVERVRRLQVAAMGPG